LYAAVVWTVLLVGQRETRTSLSSQFRSLGLRESADEASFDILLAFMDLTFFQSQ